MTAFYNENDAYPAAWLRNLIDAGHLPAGTVDERSIVDLEPQDIAGAQAHFFAGIGGWPYALRLAGWPDDATVWTGSCPCQPFSAAGKRGGHADERHLWPAWFRLIRERRPDVVFGEQVASKDGIAWLGAVRADLEGIGYAVGGLDLPAACIGAPHIRQRVFFVADAQRGAAERLGFAVGGTARGDQGAGAERERVRADARDGGDAGELADAADADRRRGIRGAQAGVGAHGERRGRPASGGAHGLVGDAGRAGLEGHAGDVGNGDEPGRFGAHQAQSIAAAGGPTFWSRCDWLPCRDGKARPVEPGIQPLAHGVPARVGKLRAAGNAIVPQVAAEFVMAFMEWRNRCA